MKRTPWFSGDVKPARRGVYERDFAGWYSKWDGNSWYVGDGRKNVAALERHQMPGGCFQWRGLTERAK